MPTMGGLGRFPVMVGLRSSTESYLGRFAAGALPAICNGAKVKSQWPATSKVVTVKGSEVSAVSQSGGWRRLPSGAVLQDGPPVTQGRPLGPIRNRGCCYLLFAPPPPVLNPALLATTIESLSTLDTTYCYTLVVKKRLLNHFPLSLYLLLFLLFKQTLWRLRIRCFPSRGRASSWIRPRT